MRVSLTRNLDKPHSFVNGMMATVRRMRRCGVEALTDAGVVVLVHSYTQDCELADGRWERVSYFPMRLGYATTLAKIQGGDLGPRNHLAGRPVRGGRCLRRTQPGTEG